MPPASVTILDEIKEASSKPRVQLVMGFREAGVDWSSRNGVEVTMQPIVPTAASLACLRRI